jgi:hypothetical protein
MEKKLMNVADYEDGSSLWRVACDCGSTDHDVHMWFEPEPGCDMVSLNLKMEVGFYNKHSDSLWAKIRDFKRRIRHAAKVLFTGYATVDGDVILDEDGIRAMKLALEKGLEHAQHRNKNKN